MIAADGAPITSDEAPQSVLSARIMSQGGGGPELHPWGTGETPLVTPMAHVTYDGNQVLYGTVQPLVTADGGVIPASGNVRYPDAIPAGQP